MPAVSPGTTTGSEIVLFLRTGFFSIIFVFYASRSSGKPAVGA